MMEKHLLRNRILIFFMVLLLLPAAERLLHFVSTEPLKGAITEMKDPTFTTQEWFSGEYQRKKERYLDQQTGFAPLMIRTYNQVLYTLFRKARAKDVVIGKNDFLFEENYIRAFYGQDFVGSDSIRRRMDMLKYLHDTLALEGKTVLVVFAPGKGSFYPEYIPAHYKEPVKETNYRHYIQEAERLSIHHIDFNKYFIDNKDASPYPLFPKSGIHWSRYGACLAIDSIIKYLEHVRNIDMPDIYWKKIQVAEANNEDYDIGDGLNLLVPLKKDVLGYPDYHFEKGNGKIKPSAMVIADSFYWVLCNMGISAIFDKNDFWYYNEQVYTIDGSSISAPQVADSLDLVDEISKRDVIIILAGESTLPGFGWGFIERAYHFFHSTEYMARKQKEMDAKVKALSDYIKSDTKWMEQIVQKAGERNISVDSMVTLDAIYSVKMQMKK